MSNYLVLGTNPDDPPEYDNNGSGDIHRAADYKIIKEEAVDAGVAGHFDGLTPIEEVKRSFQRPQIAGVDW